MTITEIIKRLVDILAEDGDLEATCYNPGFSDEITDVEVEVGADGKRVWIG
ncbi:MULTISPECIES: hypothetical protein [Nocardia]|uniref:hypothetical protein n=1 Tax=Nocardia TaxID=1817 RepID=UPI000A89E21A|nr:MULTISPECIES: hypothetical protein [Nocardia]